VNRLSRESAPCARQGTARRDVAIAIAFARAPEMRPGGCGIGKIFRAIFRESAPGFGQVTKLHVSNLTTVVVTLSLPSARPSSLARLASMVANESLKTCARCKQTLDNTQGNFPHGSSWCIKCAPPDSDSD
jgi:hypothetical protein